MEQFAEAPTNQKTSTRMQTAIFGELAPEQQLLCVSKEEFSSNPTQKGSPRNLITKKFNF